MKGKKHRPEQIIKKLREADAMLAVRRPRATAHAMPTVDRDNYFATELLHDDWEDVGKASFYR